MVFKDNIKHSDTFPNIHNTYLSIFDKPEYDNKIIFEVKDNFDLNLCTEGLFIKNIRYTDNSALYIFEIPKEYKDDLYLIINGKYSKLSEKYKRKLLYFWSADKDSILFGILFKDKHKVFTANEYYANKYTIDHAEEYYIKPFYIELIYGIR